MMQDEELIRQISQNNVRALEHLIQKYHSSLMGIVLYFVKDQEISEELVSDVFIYIWLNRLKINIQGSVKSYIFKAAKNQALQFLRKKQLPKTSLDEQHVQALKSDQNSDQLIHQQEVENKMQSDLAFLPDQQKMVFVLHRLEGFSYKEIASMLDISTHTVRNHMFQALKQLREKFQNSQPKS